MSDRPLPPRRAGRFRRPRRPGLGPRHGDLVDALRTLLDAHPDVDLGELGAAVRLQLGQREVGRPEQRISELANGSRFPTPAELDAIVQRCAGSAPAVRERFAQLHTAATRERQARRAASPTPSPAVLPAAAAGTRVGDPRSWTRLGVHAPITLLSDGRDVTDLAAAGELPGYVLREVDQTELRPALQAAADGVAPPVRLVVIVGESAAGKSRAAAEAARAVLPDWALVVPRSSADLIALHPEDPAHHGGAALARVVVWLDEVQDLLIEPDAVAALRRLLDLQAGPVVLLATLRTDAEIALRDTPGWQLLDRADHRITLQRRTPNPAARQRELARARDLAAAGDPWLGEALGKIGDRYGIAEWLAAGPQLLRELERASSTDADLVARTGAALVRAALDCYRGGYTHPVPAPLLQHLARFYLNEVTGSDADGVFAAALEWARRPVAGATGLLVHQPARGDLAFDYLIGDASRACAPPVPDPVWPILARHLTPATHVSVTLAAARNGHQALARQLAHRRGDVALYATLYVELGDLDGLADRADAGDQYAAIGLADLLAGRGDEAGLQRRADAGDRHAATWLTELLAGRGDEIELGRRADAGDQYAADRLAGLLAERGDEAGLAHRADAGDRAARYQLAVLLAGRGDEAGLARHAAAGDQHAVRWLAGLLAGRGDEVALQLLARAGDQIAAGWLTDLLVGRGDEGGLARRAEAGDQHAAGWLAELLVRRGDEAGLARRADASDQQAAYRLAGLLVGRGDEAGLARRADAGDQAASSALAELLAERGDEAGLQRRADADDRAAADRLAGLLVARGDETGLQRRADAGDQTAADRLAGLRERPQ